MKLFIKVKTKARQNKVNLTQPGHYDVWVKAVPERGKANQAVIELIAEHLKCPKNRLEIVQGFSSKNKVIEFYGE